MKFSDHNGNATTLTGLRKSQKARSYMGDYLYSTVQRLKIRPERKDQIYNAFVDFYKRSTNKVGDHKYVKDQLISPNINDLAINVKKSEHHTSYNIDRGGRELPVMLSVNEQLKLNNDPQVVYAPTYTMQDIQGWKVPETLKKKIENETPEYVKTRPSGWSTRRDRGETIHEPFVKLVSYNIKELCEDFKYKKQKNSLSIKDLFRAKLLISLDQADGHNIAVRIICGNRINSKGQLNIKIEVIDSVRKDSSFKRRPHQDYDYTYTLKKIIQHYFKELVPQDFEKLNFLDIKPRYIRTQIAGYCVFHAQKSTLNPSKVASTNEDYVFELKWLLGQLRQLRKEIKPTHRELSSDKAAHVYDHLSKIYDAVTVDARRVYFNREDLYNRGGNLPTLQKIEGKNRQVILTQPEPVKNNLRKYAKWKIPKKAPVSAEGDLLLQSRKAVERKLKAALKSQSHGRSRS